MLKSIKVSKVIYFICTLFVGGVLSLYFQDLGWFVYGNNISLVDIIELCVTSAIGIYIATSLQTNIENKKVEKEILFSRVDYIDVSLDSLLMEIMSNQPISIFRVNGVIGSCRKL